MVVMATHNASLKNGMVSIKSIMSRLLLDLTTKLGTRLKLRHRSFIAWPDIQIRCKLSNLHIYDNQ